MVWIHFLSSANKCLLKVGAYCAQLEQYQKAIEIYEQVRTCSSTCICASRSHSDGISDTFCIISMSPRLELTQWTTHCWSTAPKSISSKPPSVISSLTSSMPRRVYTSAPLLDVRWQESKWILTFFFFSPQIAVEKYEEMFPAFSDSRECKLLKVAQSKNPEEPDRLSFSFFLICSVSEGNLYFFFFYNRNYLTLTRNRTVRLSQRQ